MGERATVEELVKRLTNEDKRDFIRFLYHDVDDESRVVMKIRSKDFILVGYQASGKFTWRNFSVVSLQDWMKAEGLRIG